MFRLPSPHQIHSHIYRTPSACVVLLWRRYERKEVSGGKERLPFVSAYPVTIATTVLGYRPNDTIDCGLL